MESTDNPHLARERILQIAAEMFLQNGYKATSVRKICQRANVNVAMVNYYFRSKEALYLAVLDFARRKETFAPEGEIVADGENVPPLERLRAAIGKLVSDLLMPGHSSMLPRLIAWELVDPSFAIGTIAEKDIKPEHQFFSGLIREITGGALDEEDVQKCVFSIIGQAVFYATGRRVHKLAAPEITYDQEGIRRIAEHIYRFSAAALAGLPHMSREK